MRRTMDLKNLEDYPKEVIDQLDNMTEHPIEKNMIPLKGNFSDEEVTGLRTRIRESLYESFASIFPSQLIYLVTNTIHEPHLLDYFAGNVHDPFFDMPFFNEYYIKLSNSPAAELMVKYSVANEEFTSGDKTYPSIWVYTEDRKFKSFLLGISSDFSLNFTLADSTRSIQFSEHTDPEGDIQDIKNIQKGYSIMVERNAKRFTDKVRHYINLEADDRFIK
jgi:hypothetical protein